MFDPIEDVIAAVGRGEVVLVVDDEKRENEGDLIFAADHVTPNAVNFMVRHGRGLVCVALDRERLQKLRLSRMATRGTGDHFGTAFMESVDAKRNVTTGISAHDRAETIRVLVDPDSTDADLVSPGHTFPLEAKDGGVLRRAGHTEASVDLARLAGCRPAGVMCEILREDGAMARLPELVEFARLHDIRMTSVADLIAYRRRTEKLVTFLRAVKFPTNFGIFKLSLYESLVDGEHHVALTLGEPEKADTPLVRVHSECLTGDVFHSLRCVATAAASSTAPWA